jgi:4-hydroxybenzoate polyprenyltransferase
LFGSNSKRWLQGFMIASLVLMALALIVTPMPPERVLGLIFGLIGIWLFGLHMLWQLRRLDIEDPASCMKMFRSNRDAGLIPALFLAVAVFL